MDAKEKNCLPDPDSSPKVGMVFLSEDHAYDFYNQYAKSVGFSVRKDSSTVRPDGTVIRRVLCCSKQGYYKSRASFTNLRSRSRTGCEARIIILRRGDKFLLIEFKELHNHELVPQSEVYRLRSQRKIEDRQGKIMRNMYDAGIGPADIYSSMCKTYGGPQNLSFTKADCVNYLQKRKWEDCNGKIGDDPGTSSSQCNDLAHLALTIVAKGNSSESSVVFTRRLLTQVLDELNYFLKPDYDKTRDLVDVRDVKHEIVCDGKDCADEVDASIRLCDISHMKVNGEAKGKLERGKDKKKFQKISSGLCDQSSVGDVGTTLLMLQDSSTLPKHHD